MKFINDEDEERLHSSVKVTETVKVPKMLLKEKGCVFSKTYSNMNLSMLQQNLGNCLQIIDDEVMKGYISQLENLPVVEASENQLQNLKEIQFFKITELVYQEDEFSVHKFATIFHCLSNKSCTLVLMVKSNGERNEFYLGVRSLNQKNSTNTMMQMLKQSLIGQFPGSRIEPYYDTDMKSDMQGMRSDCISSVTCVADFKQQKN